MKRVYITTLITAMLAVALVAAANSVWNRAPALKELKVGFVYENDGSTPYTYNFMLAQNALERELGESVKVYTCSNVSEGDTLEPIRELVRTGCGIIFVNNYSAQVIDAARECPDVQFCQTSYFDGEHEDLPKNYHTFNGEIYQGRYVSGVAAGLKLREMIDSGAIAAGEALVGYVGAFRSTEVMSGCVAFMLGVRSAAPEATMRVRYTGSWSSYSRDKACAKALIEEGCVVLSEHTDTIGVAVACEEDGHVVHVGYNQDMADVAPLTSLISCRINWAPYVIGAVEAVLARRNIEDFVDARIHGNDACGGLTGDWVQILKLNRQVAAEGSQEQLDQVVEALKKGTLEVFKGEYTGVNPDDPSDTVDLRQGYRENDKTSWATFHYLLEGVITEV